MGYFTHKKIRYIVSGGALVVVLIHVVWPSLKIDTVTTIFLILAALPWLAPWLKSVEVPGVGKIEMRTSGVDIQRPNEIAARVREGVRTDTPPESGQVAAEVKRLEDRGDSVDQFWKGARAGVMAVADLLEALTFTVRVDGVEQRRDIGRELAPKLRDAAELLKPSTQG